MGRSKIVESFDDDRTWTFNQGRTRAARCRQLGSFDQYGLKFEVRIEVWHVAAKRQLASYDATEFRDLEGNDVGPQVCGVAFTEDERELIIQYSDGDERRETIPRHFENLPEIITYVEELREALTGEQVARVESLDTTGDLPSDTRGGATESGGLGYLLADAACRRFAPPAFDAAGLPDAAQRLRAMAPINSRDMAREALEVCKTLEEGCDQEALTDILSAAASAVEAARGVSSSAGGHAAEVASRAQKEVGEGTEITDAAIEFIRELTDLSRVLPLPEDVVRFVEQTDEVSDLEMLKKFYRSEIVHILIDIRIEELGEASYRRQAEWAEHMIPIYEQKALQAEKRVWEHQQGARDVEGRNQDYEHGARLRRAQRAEENKRKYEQRARDAENKKLYYERLARELEEKKRIYEQYVLQAKQGDLKRPERKGKFSAFITKLRDMF
jgi:hypothetical protein